MVNDLVDGAEGEDEEETLLRGSTGDTDAGEEAAEAEEWAHGFTANVLAAGIVHSALEAALKVHAADEEAAARARVASDVVRGCCENALLCTAQPLDGEPVAVGAEGDADAGACSTAVARAPPKRTARAAAPKRGDSLPDAIGRYLAALLQPCLASGAALVKPCL
eukprot:7386567-Prymnesium_polylepis.2